MEQVTIDSLQYSSGSNTKSPALIMMVMDYINVCAQKLRSSQLSLPHGTKQKRIMKKLKT